MATNLQLDDALIAEAVRAGGHRTKKEAVMTALREYVQRTQQLRLIGEFGNVAIDPDYDYKAARKLRCSQ
ncbi:MAG TPA: type II toxin-antitoxin system VapB family antitoxin [Terriglobales bacterium]